MTRLTQLLLISATAMALAACGGDTTSGSSDTTSGNGGGGGGGGGGDGIAQGEGPCNAASECAGGVCVALIDGNNPPNYCTQSCGECPSGFYCDRQTFGLVGLQFCRFGATEPAQVAPPESPPRLPCKVDTDCERDLVCAEYEGVRDCTIVCAAENDCTPPSLGGISMDLMTCIDDGRTDQTRTVCLPDKACFPDATSCISGFPGPF